MFSSIAQVKRANEEIGHCWFRDDTMAYFGTMIESRVYPALDYSFFISSEKDPDGEAWFGHRRFTIRGVNANGSIFTVGEFGQFFSLAEARIAIMDIIRNNAGEDK